MATKPLFSLACRAPRPHAFVPTSAAPPRKFAIGLDIGTTNFALAVVEVNEKWGDARVVRVEHINIHEMEHTRVPRHECTLSHRTMSTHDKVQHLYQERKELFDEASALIAEFTPPANIARAVFDLILGLDQNAISISAVTMQRQFGVVHGDSRERRKDLVFRGVLPFCTSEVREKLVAAPRAHDMTDAAGHALVWLKAKHAEAMLDVKDARAEAYLEAQRSLYADMGKAAHKRGADPHAEMLCVSLGTLKPSRALVSSYLEQFKYQGPMKERRKRRYRRNRLQARAKSGPGGSPRPPCSGGPLDAEDPSSSGVRSALGCVALSRPSYDPAFDEELVVDLTRDGCTFELSTPRGSRAPADRDDVMPEWRIRRSLCAYHNDRLKVYFSKRTSRRKLRPGA